jgi:hypothetical protein
MSELSARGFLRGGGWMRVPAATRQVGTAAQAQHPAIPDCNSQHFGLVRARLAVRGLLAAAALLAGAGAAAGQESCIACHENRDFMIGVAGDSARGTRLWVDPEEYAATVHGSFGFTCLMCHTTIGDFPHESVPPVNCGGCHPASQRQLAASVHGHDYGETGLTPATCADCHTDHHIRRVKDPRSTVYRLTQFEGCANCHEDREYMARFGQENVETVSTYLHSVHGRGLLEKGLSVAPVCTDCHGEQGTGAHEIKAVSNTTGAMNRTRVVETCGRCHAGIMARYDRGIHGQMFRAGNVDAPTCVSCHGEHGVQPIASPTSGVNPRHVSQTCTDCHDREDFNQKYGVRAARGRTFSESFHGIALESGQLSVANCESCHGAHDILPSTDPASSINPANLTRTCGSCHPGIGEGVAQGRIHVASPTESEGNLGTYVQWFYILVIGGTVFYALALFLLDQYRYRVVDPRRRSRGTHD